MSLLQYLTHQQAFNRIDKNKTPILLRKIVSNQVHTVEPYWLWQAVLNRILGKRRDLRRLLSRLLWFFMFFSLPQSVPAQSLNVFEHFKQDSIPTERQLYGLLAALRDSSATIRTQALNRLDESPWGGLLPDAILATIASHIDSNHQFQAIAALNAFGDQSSLSDAYLEQVIPLLKDQNSNVRRYAVEALGSQAALSDGYLQQIVPLLKDQDSDVRRYAAYAMGSQASLSKAYFQQIAPLLKDQDSYVRRHTAEALGNQTSLSDAVLQQIVPLLKDQDSDVRSYAVQALGSQASLSKAYFQQILSLLTDQNRFVRSFAAKALGRQASLSKAYLQQILRLLKDQNSTVRSFAVEALRSQASLSKAYLQQIVPLLKDQNSTVRSAAAYALGRQASLPDAVLQQIVPLLKDQDDGVRHIATEALGSQASLSKAYLQQIVPLLKDQDDGVRHIAALALGIQASLPDMVLQQIVPLLKDQNGSVRSYAALALSSQASLPNAVLQQIAPLLKDQDSSVRRDAVLALRSQASLSKAYLEQIVPLLKDQDSKVRRDAAYALGSQSVPSDAILQQIIPLLKDKNSNVRRSAAQTLGSQSVLSGAILQQISPLLKDHDSYVRRTAWQNMYEASIAIWYQAFPIVANQALLKDDDKFREDSYESRVPLYEISGGNDTIIFLLKWLCRPSKYPAEIPLKEAQKTLNLIIGLESAMDTLPIFKEEVGKALPELIKAAEKQWRAKDIVSLQKGWGIIQEANPTKADYVRGVIRSIQSKNWFYRLTLAISIHAIFWLLLLFVYPYSPMIQAIFFWNPKMRKWLGLGYVSFLITWIPFLRQRLFAPFKEVLLAEAFPSNWQKAEYFPNSEVYSTRDKKKLAVAKALHPLKGQILLQGESGLGKTMFLRNVAASSKRIIAYLPASKCTTGLIPAIQQKVHGAAADPNFLQQLIYAGAIDILIDGLNEISARACAQLTLEIERYFKGNLLLTSQPMEWEPPSSAKRYELRPLSEPQIEAFLLSRYPYLEQGDLIPESAYQKHGKAYLQAAFRSELDKETLKANRHILSNPMDLALVAQLIARGETPSLLDLQQQQYELMAASYKVNNLSNEFPLGAFSEAVYKMRINDKPEIPHEAFPKEMLSMERWKMVISRQVQMEGQEKSVKQWYFRHDKIMDYFLTQEFLAHPKLCEKHLDDPRFRGVYFLLAYKLKYDDAMLLRERLIQHAAETKDHSLSDTFIQLIRRREKPQMKNKDELKIQILEAISMGETSIALEVLQGHAAGAQEETVAMVANRANTLKNAIIEGIISLEDAQLQRNQINRAILDLVEVVG